MAERTDIYVINEQVRQAVITIIERAVHPSVPLDQLNSLLDHLKGLEPVQVLDEKPAPSSKVTYGGPDNNCCGEPAESASPKE